MPRSRNMQEPADGRDAKIQPTPNGGQQRSMVSAIFYLLAITGALYNTSLLPGRTFLPADLALLTSPWKQHIVELDPGFDHVARRAWDPLFQFYPARQYLRRSLLSGVIPLWNPSSLSGTPFAADDQSAVFYPLNWLYALFPLSLAFGWVAAIHTFLTGLFFVLYGRRLGWRMSACLTGATAWMLCGVMVVWQMWQVVDDALCWLPLALYYIEGYYQSSSLAVGRHGRSQIVGAGCALGLSALAGHLQFACYVWMAALAYAAFRGFAESTQWRRAVVGVAAIIALGVGMASVQLLLTADYLQHTQRNVAGPRALSGMMMPPAQLITLVAPDLFGGERDWTQHDYTGVGSYNYYELTAFCGAAALSFGIYGLTLGRRRGSGPFFWLGVAVFALLMGCGSPVYMLFDRFIPLFKSFHGPARILVLLDFAVAVLCAEGVNRLSDMNLANRRRTAIRVFAGLFVAILLGWRFAVTSESPTASDLLAHAWLVYGLTQTGAALAAAALACIVIAGTPVRYTWLAVPVVALESLLFAVGVNVGAPSALLFPSTPDTRVVSAGIGDGRVFCLGDGDPAHYQSRMVPNTAMALGWNDVAGSDPLILKSYQPIADTLDRAQETAPAYGENGSVAAVRPLLNQLNVRYLVSPRPLGDPDLRQVYDGDIYVYRNNDAYGMARLSGGGGSAEPTPARSSPPPTSRVPGPKREGEEFPESPSRLLQTPSGTELPLTSGPDGRETAVYSAAGPVALSTSLIAAQGWKATIDGKPLQLTANLPFLSASLPSGRHRLALEYLPDSGFVGFYVTCLACMCAFAAKVIRISNRD